MPPAITGWRAQQWEMFGANLLDADSAGIIGTDPERPVALSAAIVDPARLRELLASPHAPPLNAPLAIRFSWSCRCSIRPERRLLSTC